MSVEVKNLTKVYGTQVAVDNVTFKANNGEILGFLGPNGAGKSTTMKVATGFISATKGSVTVAGFDVEHEPMRSRASIGYLPEHNPLYLDMYVHEYLEFSGFVYGLKGGSFRSQVGHIIKKCGLKPEQNKKVGALSKGYRQRVGLAQALLHDPKVLILDEPTTGLDPNQILEIRKLIKEISLDKTVIFSTHIMQEVQALCDRVVIINKGRIVADKTIDELSRNNDDTPRLQVEFSEAMEADKLSSLNGVKAVDQQNDKIFILETDATVDVRSTIFRKASEEKWPLAGLQEVEGSLEDVFHDLTRDE